jgi:hypothetical protein
MHRPFYSNTEHTEVICYFTCALSTTVPRHLVREHPPDHELSGILTTESKLKVLEHLRKHQPIGTGDLTIIADEEITHAE